MPAVPHSASVAMPAAASAAPHTTERRVPERADHRPAAETGDRREALADDVRTHAREHAQPEMPA